MGNCFVNSAKLAHVSSTNMGTPEKFKPNESANTSSETTDCQSFNLQDPSIKNFNLSDLKTATKNFSSNTVVGEGGFGLVFKGWIDEKTMTPTKPGTGKVIAVKRLKATSLQGHKEWLAEVNYLGQFRHNNLVKLIGYCAEGDTKILVYEYMSKGSLENHLFRTGTPPLAWSVRLAIATDVARGLSFLHGVTPTVIYRDLKPSNILLDANFNAKLSDFGLAREGPMGDDTHVSTKVVGTRGYAAPEYVSTGRLTAKSDVYSFGVVLLELLTGRRALEEDRNGVASEGLVAWAIPYLRNSKRIFRIMDMRLGGQYPKKCAQATGALVLRCLDANPKFRPQMPEVLASLEELRTARVSRHANFKSIDS